MVRKINAGGPSRLYSSWLKGNLVIGGGDVGPANEYFVDEDNGNARNDGLSWERAKATIQAGLDLCVGTGETVYVAPQTYTETVTTPASATASATTLWGIGDSHRGQGARITPVGDTDALTVLQNNFTVRNMRLGASTTGTGLMLDSNTGSVIHSITIDHCHFSGGLYGVESVGGSSFVCIKDSLFRFILETGGRAITCTDISETNPNVWEVFNNVFYANENHIYFANAENCSPFSGSWHHNIFHDAAVGVPAATKKLGLSNNGAQNAIFANFLGGTFSIAGGYEGGATDTWYSNYCSTGIDAVADPG